MSNEAARAKHGAIVRAAVLAASEVVVREVGTGVLQQNPSIALVERVTAMLAVSYAISDAVEAVLANGDLPPESIESARRTARSMAALATEQAGKIDSAS